MNLLSLPFPIEDQEIDGTGKYYENAISVFDGANKTPVIRSTDVEQGLQFSVVKRAAPHARLEDLDAVFFHANRITIKQWITNHD